MELDKIVITKFRSIKKSSLSISEITALVGENNTGKSAILRALNAFFNYEVEKEHFVLRHHQYSTTSLPRIELQFSKVPSIEDFLNESINGTLTVRITFNPKNDKRTIHIKKSGKYYATTDAIIEKIKLHLDFVFIPPIRDPDQIKCEENTLLRKLLKESLGEATTNRDNFTSKFIIAARNIERNGLNKIASRINSFYSINHNFTFQINYAEELTFNNFLHDIVFKVKESGIFYELEDSGSGIQSLTFIALYRLLSSMKKINIIIGLEEPETNLHPQAQKEFIASLKKTINNNSSSKIIFTTHSPVIIDQLQHEQVFLFRKVPDSNRGYQTVIKSIANNFFDNNDIEEPKYYQFHHYMNSEFFYSKFVVIVESKNDAQVVKLLAEKAKIDIDALGISIINLEGINNIKYPYYLLKDLGIPFMIILDKDYFLPYFEDELQRSRDSYGFPKYKYEYKKNCLIEVMVQKQADRNLLLKNFRKNHSKALDILENHNIVCMNYSLEIDLVGVEKGRDLMYQFLNIPLNERNSFTLLTKWHKKIKTLELLLFVVSGLTQRNLPHPYSRIIKMLKNIEKDILK